MFVPWQFCIYVTIFSSKIQVLSAKNIKLPGPIFHDRAKRSKRDSTDDIARAQSSLKVQLAGEDEPWSVS